MENPQNTESSQEYENKESDPQHPIMMDNIQTEEQYFLHCYLIMIGCYKVKNVSVTLSRKGFFFEAPVLSNCNSNKHVHINLGKDDIEQIHVYLKESTMLSIITTPKFADSVGRIIQLGDSDIRKLSIWGESLMESQRCIIHKMFHGEEKKIIEVDHSIQYEVIYRGRVSPINGLEVKQNLVATPSVHLQAYRMKLKRPCEREEANNIPIGSPKTKRIKLENAAVVSILLSQASPPVFHQQSRLNPPHIKGKVPLVYFKSSQSEPLETTNNIKKLVTRQGVMRYLEEQNERLFEYRDPSKQYRIILYINDFNTLNEGQLLNDSIIEFYSMYLYYEKLSPEFREVTYCFTSYFYEKLTSIPAGNDDPTTLRVRRYEKIKRWTKSVDIFEKMFILVPLHTKVYVSQNKTTLVESHHWILAIICFASKVPEDKQEHTNKITIKDINTNLETEEISSSDNILVNDDKQKPCICFIDSMRMSDNYYAKIAFNLREYLTEAYKNKKKKEKTFTHLNMPTILLDCPQQPNVYDCGMYLLQFMEIFCANPMKFFETDLINQFKAKNITKIRKDIQEFILTFEK